MARVVQLSVCRKEWKRRQTKRVGDVTVQGIENNQGQRDVTSCSLSLSPSPASLVFLPQDNWGSVYVCLCGKRDDWKLKVCEWKRAASGLFNRSSHCSLCAVIERNQERKDLQQVSDELETKNWPVQWKGEKERYRSNDSPSGLCNDHFGSEGMETFPEIFWFQTHFRIIFDPIVFRFERSHIWCAEWVGREHFLPLWWVAKLRWETAMATDQASYQRVRALDRTLPELINMRIATKVHREDIRIRVSSEKAVGSYWP